MRLDKFLAQYGENSRSYFQKLIRKGQVEINGCSPQKSMRLERGQEVEVNYPRPRDPEIIPEEIPLDIRYEDSDLLVINKQAGMVVHPAPGHEDGTLVNALLFHCRDLAGIGAEKRPGIVHRLDKDTTGLLVVAKTEASLEELGRQFKKREIEKNYLALVCGEPEEQRGEISAPIGRSPRDRKKMAVTAENSRRALTRFSVKERLGGHALLLVQPVTGRTHQIRVHLSHIGYPILGDSTYGGGREQFKERQLLHAWRLGFQHPKTDKWMEFEAPLPADFRSVLSKLRGSSPMHPKKNERDIP